MKTTATDLQTNLFAWMDKVIYCGKSLEIVRNRVIIKIQRASSLTWTRDPSDRIIAANDLYLEIPLLTKDQAILDNVHGLLGNPAY
jgi:PIN domain nuclease of toxin-antitoxin system